jgi:acetyl esterase/lipase
MLLRYVVLLLALCGAAKATELDLSYGPRPEQKLDICSPETGAARPAVLLLHGGGWVKGSKLDMDRHCAGFIAHGFVAIPVDFRLAGSGPNTYWPAQIEDVQLALRWVRQNAGRLGVDARHICAYGESSGGHLALMLGTARRIESGDMAEILPAVSPRADCVVSLAGPADLRALQRVKRGMVEMLTGPVSSGVLAAEAASGSPALRADTDSAPALLIHGANDLLVPYAQAIEMRDALSAAGVPAWLITHPGGHGLKDVKKAEGRAIWEAVFTFLARARLPGEPGVVNVDDIAVN